MVNIIISNKFKVWQENIFEYKDSESLEWSAQGDYRIFRTERSLQFYT